MEHNLIDQYRMYCVYYVFEYCQKFPKEYDLSKDCKVFVLFGCADIGSEGIPRSRGRSAFPKSIQLVQVNGVFISHPSRSSTNHTT